MVEVPYLMIFVKNMTSIFQTWMIHFLLEGDHNVKAHEITNLHHYQVELFYVVIDIQLQELNSRFTVVNTELLLCVAYLNPSESFVAFAKQMLIRLAQFYPHEFSPIELMILNKQFETYIIHDRSNVQFLTLKEFVILHKKWLRRKNILCIH